jgi:hypothetical protein
LCGIRLKHAVLSARYGADLVASKIFVIRKAAPRSTLDILLWHKICGTRCILVPAGAETRAKTLMDGCGKTKSRRGVKFVVVPVRNGYVARPIIPHLPVKL